MSTTAPLQTQGAKPQSLSSSTPTGLLLHRKRACGSPTSSLTGDCAESTSKKLIQTKLTIGASNDPLEQEADRVADEVMAKPSNPAVSDTSPRIRRFTEQVTGQEETAPASVDRVLARPGRPLEPTLQQDMAQRFGHNFSSVRVHVDAAADLSAREVNAHAYTVGNSIVFGAGHYGPQAHEGRRLIAHELTHVVQQSGSSSQIEHSLARESDKTPFPTSINAPRLQREGAKLALLFNDAINSSDWSGAVRAVAEMSDSDAHEELSALNLYARQKLLTIALQIDPLPSNRVARLIDSVETQAVTKSTPGPLSGSAVTKSSPVADAVAGASGVAKVGNLDATTLRPIDQIPTADIAIQWKSRRDAFLLAASDPSNLLNGHQHFQIWFQYWIEACNIAVDAEKQLREAIAKKDKVAYANNKDLFDNYNKRDALGPTYEKAANQLDTCNTFLNEQTTILNWLEDWVDSGHHHVTFHQVNDHALEEAKVRGLFMTWMEPIIMLSLGAGGGARPSAVSEATELSAPNRAKTDPVVKSDPVVNPKPVKPDPVVKSDSFVNPKPVTPEPVVKSDSVVNPKPIQPEPVVKSDPVVKSEPVGKSEPVKPDPAKPDPKSTEPTAVKTEPKAEVPTRSRAQRLEEIEQERNLSDAKIRDLDIKRLNAEERSREASLKAVNAQGEERKALLEKTARNRESAEKWKNERDAERIRNNRLRDEEGRLAPPPLAPKSWPEAEDALRKEFGGQKQALSADSGRRDIDCFTHGDRVSREAKFGKQNWSTRLQEEIDKDVELMKAGKVSRTEWHFYENPSNGEIGPNSPLKEALDKAGIGAVIK